MKTRYFIWNYPRINRFFLIKENKNDSFMITRNYKLARYDLDGLRACFNGQVKEIKLYLL